MEQIQYNFTWEKHTDHFRDMLYNMMNTKVLTDVTLVCDDHQEFRAHKVILSACSPVFSRIIEKLSNKDSVIYLRRVYSQEMKAILDYIYLGQTLIDKAFIHQFLSTAENLEIKDLWDKKFENSLGNETNQGNFNESQPNQCPESGCKKVFTMQEFMLRHHKSKHSKDKETYLKTHIQSEHIQNLQESFQCQLCNLYFKDQRDLSKHIRISHYADTPSKNTNVQNHSQDDFIGHVELDLKADTYLQSNYEAVYEIDNDSIIVDDKSTQHQDKDNSPFREQNGLFFCNKCSKKYTSERYIRFHIQSSH